MRERIAVFYANFYFSTAQKIFAISSDMDKNSSRSFARLSAWCVRALHASG